MIILSNYKKTLDFLANEIADFSKELPISKNCLDKLLLEEKPGYFNRKKIKISFTRPDLLNLATIVPKRYHSSVRLPFLFIYRDDHFFFSGTDIEKFVIENLIDLGSQDDISRISKRFFSKSYESKHEYYYAYMIKRIRKRIPSLVLVAYSTG